MSSNIVDELNAIISDPTTNPEHFAVCIGLLNVTGRLRPADSAPNDIAIGRNMTKRPDLLTMYLSMGFGCPFYSQLITCCLRNDNVESLQIILTNTVIAERIRIKNDMLSGVLWDDWIPLAKVECLSYLLNTVALSTDQCMQILARQGIDLQRILLRHPKYKHIIYIIPKPTTWIVAKHRALWGITSIDDISDSARYIRMDVLFASERKLNTSNNIRSLFWLSVLAIRMRQFRERFWAPGGKKEQQLKIHYDGLIK